MQTRNKKSASFRLSPIALNLLKSLADSGGVSQAAVLETLIREAAKRENIKSQ